MSEEHGPRPQGVSVQEDRQTNVRTEQPVLGQTHGAEPRACEGGKYPCNGMHSKQELSWAERIKGIPRGRGERGAQSLRSARSQG